MRYYWLFKQDNALSIDLRADQFEASTFPARATHGHLTVVNEGWGIWTGNFQPFQRNTSIKSLNMEVLKGKEFTLPSEWLKNRIQFLIESKHCHLDGDIFRLNGFFPST